MGYVIFHALVFNSDLLFKFFLFRIWWDRDVNGITETVYLKFQDVRGFI